MGLKRTYVVTWSGKAMGPFTPEDAEKQREAYIDAGANPRKVKIVKAFTPEGALKQRPL